MVRTLISTVVLMAALAAPAAAQYSLPAAGKWAVDESFDDVDGGTMVIAKGGTAVKKLKVKLDPTNEACGAGTVTLKGSVPIKRVKSAANRPAAGKLGKGGLIEPRGARFAVGGKTVRGKLLVLFEEDGRGAFTARFVLPDCTVGFSARI